MLDWAPTYLKEAKHFTVDKTSWAYFLYEWAGIPGTLLIIGSTVYSLRKRKVIRLSQPARLLRWH